MKKNLLSILFVGFIALCLVGCSNKGDNLDKLANTCWEFDYGSDWLCFNEDETYLHYVIEKDGKYITTKEDKDVYEVQKRANLTGVVYQENIYRGSDNINETHEGDIQNFEVYKEDGKTILYISFTDENVAANAGGNWTLYLDKFKFDEVDIVDKDIDIEFMGEKSTFKYNNSLQFFILDTNINLKEDRKYYFTSLNAENSKYYLLKEKWTQLSNQALNGNVTLTDALEPYRLCYESNVDSGYVGAVKQLSKDLTYIKIDYCKNFNKDDANNTGGSTTTNNTNTNSSNSNTSSNKNNTSTSSSSNTLNNNKNNDNEKEKAKQTLQSLDLKVTLDDEEYVVTLVNKKSTNNYSLTINGKTYENFTKKSFKINNAGKNCFDAVITDQYGNSRKMNKCFTFNPEVPNMTVILDGRNGGRCVFKAFSQGSAVYNKHYNITCTVDGKPEDCTYGFYVEPGNHIIKFTNKYGLSSEIKKECKYE